MSTYRSKCEVSKFLQNTVAGGLLEIRLTEACSIICYVSEPPTYKETMCVHSDVAQIFVVARTWVCVAQPQHLLPVSV